MIINSKLFIYKYYYSGIKDALMAVFYDKIKVIFRAFVVRCTLVRVIANVTFDIYTIFA